MRAISIGLAVVVLAAGPKASPEEAAVMAPVNQFVDAFNKGDVKTVAAMCADQTSIIDEFPPHEWHGAGACLTWMNDYDADAKKNGITDGFVTLGKPRHVDVTGDRAYVVIPANYVFKRKGVTVRESGSILTLALQKVAVGWRVTAWSWAKH